MKRAYETPRIVQRRAFVGIGEWRVGPSPSGDSTCLYLAGRVLAYWTRQGAFVFGPLTPLPRHE